MLFSPLVPRPYKHCLCCAYIYIHTYSLSDGGKNCVIYTKYAICSRPLFPAAAAAAGSRGEAAAENESEKTAAVPSTAPKRAKKGYGNNSIDELRISCWHARDAEGWLVRATRRVGGWQGGRIVYSVANWYCRFRAVCRILDENVCRWREEGLFIHIYERLLTDICTIWQSDANACVYVDGQFSIATLKRMTLNCTYLYLYIGGTHIILYRFSSPAYTARTLRGLRFEHIYMTVTISRVCVRVVGIMWKRSSVCSTALN